MIAPTDWVRRVMLEIVHQQYGNSSRSGDLQHEEKFGVWGLWCVGPLSALVGGLLTRFVRELSSGSLQNSSKP